MRLGILSEKYEGGGPATVSTGDGDSGGVSYGTYQLSTNAGTVAAFVEWLLARGDYGKDYGKLLALNEPGTDGFSDHWRYLAETDLAGFGALQDEYVLPIYYDAAAEIVRDGGVDIDGAPDAVKSVLFSNSIQHGHYNAGELVRDCYDTDPKVWIRSIYDTKLCDMSWSSGAPTLRPGLFNRWENEKLDALTLLAGGAI